jgi:hypothetical protein
MANTMPVLVQQVAGHLKLAPAQARLFESFDDRRNGTGRVAIHGAPDHRDLGLGRPFLVADVALVVADDFRGIPTPHDAVARGDDLRSTDFKAASPR